MFSWNFEEFSPFSCYNIAMKKFIFSMCCLVFGLVLVACKAEQSTSSLTTTETISLEQVRKK